MYLFAMLSKKKGGMREHSENVLIVFKNGIFHRTVIYTTMKWYYRISRYLSAAGL